MSKNNPNITLIKPEDLLASLKNKHLLLDTSVFIDAFLHPVEFTDFFNECKQHDVFLTTVKPVIVEFTKGVKDNRSLKERLEFVESIIDLQLPVHPKVNEVLIPQLVKSYGQIGRGLSYVNFILGGLINKHKRDLLLMSKNPADFPLSIFDLNNHLIIKMNRALQIYGIYQAQAFQSLGGPNKEDKPPF